MNGIFINELQINSFRSHKRNVLHKDKLIEELKKKIGIL